MVLKFKIERGKERDCRVRSKTGRAGRPEEEQDRKRGKRFGVKGNPPLSGREVKSVTES